METKETKAIKRRDLCRSALSVSSLLLVPGSVAIAADDAAAGELNLEKPADLLRAHVKMRCSLGPDMSIGWLRGKRFSVSEGRVEPLCGMLAATFNVLNRVSDDEIEIVTMEVSFYTDFETGELLDRVTMPFSGADVEVPVHRFGPQTVRFAVALDETEEFKPQPGTSQAAFATAGTVSMSKSIERDHERDGRLYLRHEEYGRRYPQGSDRPSMFYRETTVWSAPKAQVLDRQRQHVASDVNYSAMTSWRPWMEMGDIPGHTFSNGFGGRAWSVEALPADYREFLRRTHPDVLSDPAALLASYSAA